MDTLFEIFSRTFQSLSQSILQMNGTEWYLYAQNLLLLLLLLKFINIGQNISIH